MSERKMEVEDSVRTVDCLRGRLLAERAASRDARAETEQLQTKLMQLENLLKQEAKSRNRAEKKLRFLMKKLESMNILHVSDESEYSGSIDKTDISSTSSTASSAIKQQESNENQQTKFPDRFQTQESKGEQIDSQNSSFSLSDDSSTADRTSISCPFEAKNEDSLWSEKWSSKMEEQSDLWYDNIRCDGDDWESEVDDSMAIVVVDAPQKSDRVDPEALDATVKQVLNTLRLAKEKLQTSMVQRRIKVGKINGSAILI